MGKQIYNWSKLKKNTNQYVQVAQVVTNNVSRKYSNF